MIGLIRLTSNKTSQNQSKGCQVKQSLSVYLPSRCCYPKETSTVNTNRERGKKLFEKSVTAICNGTQRVMIMFIKVKNAWELFLTNSLLANSRVLNSFVVGISLTLRLFISGLDIMLKVFLAWIFFCWFLLLAHWFANKVIISYKFSCSFVFLYETLVHPY